MKRLLLFLLTSTAALTSYAQEGTWQRVAITDSVTVEFPAAPRKYTQNGMTAYGVYQDSVVYSVTVMRNADSENLADEDRQEFYDGVIKGTAEQLNTKEIGGRNAFNINGFEGCRVAFQAHTNKLRGPTTLGVISINGTAYSLLFCGADTKTNLIARQHFFKSFQPRQRYVPLVNSRAYRLGNFTGKILFYGLLLAVVLYLARRPKKKNRSKASA
jgi:hypothetical protein